MRLRAVLLLVLLLASFLSHASGRGRKKAKSRGGGGSAAGQRPPQAADGAGGSSYVPLDWETLAQIPVVQPGGTVPDAAEGSEKRRQLGMLGMPAGFMAHSWQRHVIKDTPRTLDECMLEVLVTDMLKHGIFGQLRDWYVW